MRSLRGLTHSTSFFDRGGRWWLSVLVVAGVLFLIAAGIVRFVERASRQLVKEQLIAVRESNAESLRLWLGHQKLRLTTTIENPRIAELTAQLSRRFDGKVLSYDALLKTEEVAEIKALIEQQWHEPLRQGWVLQDPLGRVLAASEPVLIGRLTFPLPEGTMNRALSGATTVSTPFRSPVPLNDSARAGSPVMAAVGPIRTEGNQVVGIFSLLIDPSEEFSRVMEVSRSGESGETYAVDAQGMMISKSRFENQLRGVSLLPDDPSVSSILEVSLRDPGVNLLDGDRPPVPREQLPLTSMASDLVRGGNGENIEGYNDYRGVRVVGAWRFFPEYDFGLATEIDESEAYRPLGVLRGLLWSLAAVATTAILGMAILAFLMRKFQRTADEANHLAKRMGQYVLLQPLGAGGMGTVYLGRHTLLRRPVAIKVLRSPFQGDARAQARFEREVQLTSRLTSPHTVSVYDYGTTNEGEFFYVMEFLEGIDLARLVEEFGRQPAGRVIYLLLQVCESLAEAHACGLIHRDVKPANIILCARGHKYDFTKLVDFGLVKQEDSQSALLTRTGAIAGTPMYMSPESVRDASDVQPQSDIYSLGAVAYWLLTGTPLFQPGTPMEVCMRQVGEDPVPPSGLVSGISADIEAVVMRCLEKDADKRPKSAEELANLLRVCRDASTWTPELAKRWWIEKFIPTLKKDTIVAHAIDDTQYDRSGSTSVHLDSSRL